MRLKKRGGLRLTWNPSLPWFQFTKLLHFSQIPGRPALSSVIPIPLPSEVSYHPVEKTELMQRLGYMFPLKSRFQWPHMDVGARIRAMLTVFMPEEYEGQHQLTQANCLNIELYMLSNNMKLRDRFGSSSAQDKRLLAMIRRFGWHKGWQFRNLLASQEPTVEAIVEKIFASAVYNADIVVMKVILEAGMVPDSLIEVDTELLTPLQWAARIKNREGAEMAELLVSHKADIELAQYGRSPLLEAIYKRNKEVIEVLLRHNVIVNLRCLAEATRTVHTNLFEKLWKSCPDVNSLIYDTKISEYPVQRGNITLLGAAAKSGTLENIKTILRLCPSLVNPRELEVTGGAGYFSPISVAIENYHTKALKALLDAGVDTNFVNKCEEPPIERALRGHNSRTYEVLVQSGVTIKQPLSYGRLRELMGFISKNESCLSTMKQLIDESAQLSRDVTKWSGELLAEAINNNDLLVIRLLLDSGATVIANKVTRIINQETAQYLGERGALQAILDGNGPKILLRVLECEGWDLAQWILVRAPVLLDESLYSRHTPLCSAAGSKRPELVRLMLRHGARVTDRALFMATRSIMDGFFERGVSSDGGSEVLRILLNHFNGPAPSAIAEAGIDLESTDEDVDQDISLLELLLSEGVEPTGTPEEFNEYWNNANQSEWHGLHEPQSALEIVVASGNRLGLDILIQNTYNWGAKVLGRALVVACSVAREDMVDLILQCNPKMNEAVGFWEIFPGRPNWRQIVSFSTALQVAVKLQNVSLVRKLLGSTDTDVNSPAKGVFGRTALQHAVENGNLELITMLLNHDAEVNSAPAEEAGVGRPIGQGLHGRTVSVVYHNRLKEAESRVQTGGATALQLAAIKGYLGVARRLLDLGADVNAPGAVVGGRTALEGAAEHGRIDMVHMLIDEGALIWGPAGQRQYEKAVRLARDNGHYAVARMLERFKSKAEQRNMQVSNIYVDGVGEVYEEEEHLII